MKFSDKDPKKKFGADLMAVLGPVEDRRPISDLTIKEKKEILNKIDKHISTEELGEDPSFLKITNYVLTNLRDCRALRGIDLNWQTKDALKHCGRVRHESMYFNVKQIVKNNKVQRGVWLRNLVEKILFEFDPVAVGSGLARYSTKENLFFLNDAQHRIIACIILGIRIIPLEYEESEDRVIDVRQYSRENLGSLPSTTFDEYRTMVANVEIILELDPTFKIADLGDEYVAVWDVRSIFEEHDARFIEQGGKGKHAAKILECTGVGNIKKHYNTYGYDTLYRAVAINARAYSRAPLAANNILGICEFIRIQEDANVLNNDSIAVDDRIVTALLHMCPKGDKVGFYKPVNKAITSAEKIDPDFPTISYELRWAAGIQKIINITSPNVKWADVKLGSRVIADEYLDHYIVPPLQRLTIIASAAKKLAKV